ncbi:hypothetical protein IKJ53_07740 [bacterium]|nr:hypothetical protein [bacterium]
MGYGALDSIGKTSLMMNLIAQKQRALGANLANVDTPGYVRRDIDFSQYLGGNNSNLETKLGQKMGPSPMWSYEQNVEINPANELTEMQKNSILYTMATRRMSNIITQMRTVINVGK